MTMAFLQSGRAYRQYQEQKDDISIILIEEHMGRMRPEEKKRWTDALRSGKYEQGRQVLKTPEGEFCCLGVKCDIDNVPSEIRIDVVGSDHDMIPVTHYGVAGDTSYAFIPRRYEIGLYKEGEQSNPEAEPVLYFNGGTSLFRGWAPATRGNGSIARLLDINLPTLNDEGFTFAQIADMIDYFL